MNRNNAAIALSHACLLALSFGAFSDEPKKGSGDTIGVSDASDGSDATDASDSDSDGSAIDVEPDSASDGADGDVSVLTPEASFEATAAAFCPGYAERWCAPTALALRCLATASLAVTGRTALKASAATR